MSKIKDHYLILWIYCSFSGQSFSHRNFFLVKVLSSENKLMHLGLLWYSSSFICLLMKRLKVRISASGVWHQDTAVCPHPGVKWEPGRIRLILSTPICLKKEIFFF